MPWPLRNQILLPFAVILLVTVATTALFAAWLASRRAEEELARDLDRVVATLGESSFPFSENVLRRMRGLSGAEFVVYDSTERPRAATVEEPWPALEEIAPVDAASAADRLGGRPTVSVHGVRYFSAVHRRRLGAGTTLIVLYPEAALRRARRDAAYPPLLVGGVAVVSVVLAAVWIGRRTGRRVRDVEQQVSRIAEGDFVELPVLGPEDEVRALVEAVNRTSARLREMEQTIRLTERTHLLGQLAGGLAHQLRNAVTGARLAIQLHEKRAGEGGSEGLEVALRQLALVEEHVRGLLSLGRGERRERVACGASEVVEEVGRLVEATCAHEGVAFSSRAAATGSQRIPDCEAVRTALLNLVLNAVEAAGQGGRVELSAAVEEAYASFEVVDDGPGPPAEIRETLLEPFVTSKPEGVGLGLALARQVAEELGGTLQWERAEERTVFRLRVPAGTA